MLRARILTVIFFLAATTYSWAQAPLTPSANPAVQRFQQLIEILNETDPDALREYVSGSFARSFLDFAPIDRHLEILGEFAANSGRLEPRQVRPVSDFRVQTIVWRERQQSWVSIGLSVEPSDPHRIASIGMSPAGPPLDLTGPVRSDEQLAERVGAVARQLAEAEIFSGAILLARNGVPFYRAAFGPASREFDAPNQADTRFNLGSMNKMFTAVAIAQLVERGKLSFEDTLDKRLKGWIDEEAARKISIHHLLTHTSGLGSYFNQQFQEASRARFREIDDYKVLVADEVPAFEPGTGWRYSNTGFLLLGAVIESVTGQSYFDYIRENVYLPAGMTGSDSFEMDRPTPNLAIGYSREDGPTGTNWTNNLFQHVIKGGPAGGGFSTVDDLLRFDAALRTHRLLSPEMTGVVLSAKPESGSNGYGYGFQIESDGRFAGHSGGFPGISSRLLMDLEDGFTLVVLSNYSGGSSPIENEVRALLYEMRQGNGR
jgi:CubicO group peptidase (beta-lactamase class C family)